MTERLTIGFGELDAAVHGMVRDGWAVLLSADGAIGEGPAAVTGSDDGWRVSAEGLFDVELVPLGEPAEFADGTRTWHCRATGTAGTSELACHGQCTLEPAPPGVESVRTVGIWFDAGLGLVCRAARPEGAEPDADAVEGHVFRGEPVVAVAIAESLLSTTYDADARQIRAGLELRETIDESQPPRRLAGEAVGRAVVDGTQVAFFVWRHEGLVGAGRYDIEGGR